MRSLHPILNIAIKAARRAGDFIYMNSDIHKIKFTRKADETFVTEADTIAQEKIIDVLSYAYSDHQIIAEEGYESIESDHVWYIDPIDGTNNFMHGLGHYAISIAYAYKGKLEHAVIYNPVLDELFYASKGAGAYLNNTRIRVQKRTDSSEYLISNNLWFGHDVLNQKKLDVCIGIQKEIAGFRKMGCFSLDLAYIACGRLDGLFASNLNTWDVAAGVLIAQEAGAICTNYAGDSFLLEDNELAVGASKVHDFLLPHLTQL